MGKLISGMAAGLIFAWVAGVAVAEEFEGIVHFKSTTGERSRDYDYLIKGKKTRIEVEEGNRNVSVIVDHDAQKTLMLMPERKMVMQIPMDQARPEADAGTRQANELIRTGETETILGHTCEKLISKSDEIETEICGAQGMGFYAGMYGMRRPGMGGGDNAPAWVRELKAKGFFPLRIIARGKDGTEKTHLEATKIEKKSLDPSMFVVPPDFKTFDTGG